MWSRGRTVVCLAVVRAPRRQHGGQATWTAARFSGPPPPGEQCELTVTSVCRYGVFLDVHNERVSHLHRPPEPLGSGEGRGAVLQRVRPHPRHRPEERLRLRGESSDGRRVLASLSRQTTQQFVPRLASDVMFIYLYPVMCNCRPPLSRYSAGWHTHTWGEPVSMLRSWCCGGDQFSIA